MQPQTPQAGQSGVSSLDPTIVNLAKAIRQSESGGDFQAKGKSGEYGAYQYTPQTWAQDSQKYLGQQVELTQATPEQQNEVAYKKIADLKAQGNNVGQIASIWNSGDPNAYLGKFSNGNPATGVNKFGAKYDVPAYAKSVATAYQTLKKGGQVGIDPNNPSSTANTTPLQPTGNQPDTYGALFPASSGDNPLVAGVKALGNVPSSAINLGKGIVNAVIHPIDTGTGLLHAGGGAVETVLNKIFGKNVQDINTQTYNALIGTLKDRYGSLENMQRTATNDPMGFGADVLSVLEGGASLADKLAGTTGADIANATSKSRLIPPELQTGVNATPVGEGLLSSKLNSTLSTVAQPAVSAVKYPFNLAKDSTVGLLGGLTGKGGGAVGEAINAGAGGLDSYKTFMKSLTGGSPPEQIVSEAKDALGQLVQERSNTYKQMLSGIKADPTTYDISPIENQIDKGLNDFNITKNSDGTLDFSRSKIRFDTSAQSDIQNIVDTMKGFGLKAGDRTALGIDQLKQAFGDLYSENSSVRSFVQGVKSATRSILDNTPGYTKGMADYGDMTDQIQSIQKSLSLGDSAQAETSFNKLIQAVKGNNPIKTQLLKELDQVTGGQLIPKIAGSMMSPGFSKGILGHLAEVGGLGAVMGGAGFMPLIISMMTTSPKLVGALVSTLGLGLKGTAQVMNTLTKLILPSNALNRINPQIPTNQGGAPSSP